MKTLMLYCQSQNLSNDFAMIERYLIEGIFDKFSTNSSIFTIVTGPITYSNINYYQSIINSQKIDRVILCGITIIPSAIKSLSDLTNGNIIFIDNNSDRIYNYKNHVKNDPSYSYISTFFDANLSLPELVWLQYSTLEEMPELVQYVSNALMCKTSYDLNLEECIDFTLGLVIERNLSARRMKRLLSANSKKILIIFPGIFQKCIRNGKVINTYLETVQNFEASEYI